MSLDKKFFIVSEVCDCDTTLIQSLDGYARPSRFSCFACHDSGFVNKRMSLEELKKLLSLDGYSA